MKKAINTMLILLLSLLVPAHAQIFEMSDNLMLNEISKNEFYEAFMVSKRYHKFTTDKDSLAVMEVIKQTVPIDIDAETQIEINTITNNQGEKSYLIDLSYGGPFFCYYLRPGNMVQELFADGFLNENGIYFACPYFDCDQHVWLKIYDLGQAEPKLIGELKEVSFKYYIPWLPCPQKAEEHNIDDIEQTISVFSDNDYFYFAVQLKWDSSNTKFYKLSISYK